MSMKIPRRAFVQAVLAGGTLLGASTLLNAADVKKPKLRKAVKFGMIGEGKTIEEKFSLIKNLGFQGVEVDSPSGLNKEEAVKARDKTGILIHGVIDSVHWRDTLSHPEETVRTKGRTALEGALRDAKFLGADTVLLVPGVVNKDVTYQQCWDRSTAEVRKVVPLAQELGVKIAIEVVWNDFITKPEQLIEYVDQFQTPCVGAYFDCSNMLKYGVSSAEWIRKLGKRMLKFDFKGYSRTKAKSTGNVWDGFKVGIGEGDEEWPEVLKALGEIGYDGWATAEVGGGGEKWLRDVAERMNKILELS